MSDLDHLMSLVIHEAKNDWSKPKKKSVFLPQGATVYNENFAKSYPPFDKSKVKKYNKGTTIEENWQLLRKSLNRWDQHRF